MLIDGKLAHERLRVFINSDVKRTPEYIRIDKAIFRKGYFCDFSKVSIEFIFDVEQLIYYPVHKLPIAVKEDVLIITNPGPKPDEPLVKLLC